MVLGKAKIMSYEDLEEPRTKRKAQEAVKEARLGKRSRKPKVSAQEASVAEPWECISEASEQVKVLAEQTSEPQGVEGQIAPMPWTAPVARMW